MLRAIPLKWLLLVVALIAAVNQSSALDPQHKPTGARDDPFYAKPIYERAPCNHSPALEKANQLLEEKKWEQALQSCAEVIGAACNNDERSRALFCMGRASAIANKPIADPLPPKAEAKCCPPPSNWLEGIALRLRGTSFWSTCMGIVAERGWKRFIWLLVVSLLAVLALFIIWWFPYNAYLLSRLLLYQLLDLVYQLLDLAPALADYRPQRVWVVWSVQDESKSGASGAVIDALNPFANPLLAEISNEGCSAIERPSLLLKPPLQRPDSPLRSLTHGVWRDFLSGIPRDLPDRLRTFEIERFGSEYLPGRIPRFRLDSAFSEIDVTIGKFALKGLSQLWQLYKRFLGILRPSVLGVVYQTEKDGQKAWAVRLNASAIRRRDKFPFLEKQTFSVFADSQPQEYGDPLLSVAQRAALRLVLRIMTPRMKANEAVARASFQQGIQQIKQLL